MDVVEVQPFTSVTVIVYVIPSHNALKSPVVELIVPLGVIVNTLVPLPPVVVIVAVPSQPGIHDGCVELFIAIVN